MALSMKNTQELTTEEVVRSLIQPLEAESQILASGPRIIDSPTGDPLKLPRLTTRGSAAGWYAENELIGESDPDFDEVTLLPTNLKSIKVIHRFSNELARHAVVSISALTQADLVKNVATELDKAFFNGAGTLDASNNRGVIGLANQPGIATGALTLTSATTVIDTMIDLLGKFAVAEIHDFGKVKLFVTPQNYIALQKIKGTDGRPLMVPDVQQANTFRLQGIPVVPTARLGAGKALLVDFANVVVGRDLGTNVRFLSERYADYDQIGVRVVTRLDIALLHPEAVVNVTVA